MSISEDLLSAETVEVKYLIYSTEYLGFLKRHNVSNLKRSFVCASLIRKNPKINLAEVDVFQDIEEAKRRVSSLISLRASLYGKLKIVEMVITKEFEFSEVPLIGDEDNEG